jgi:hypothetical protein
MGLFLGFGTVSKNWKTEMYGTSLSLVDSTNNIGSIIDRLFGVESSLSKII